MKIGINGRFLIAKQTGVQRAAYNLVKTLVKHDTKNQYVIFTAHSQKDNPDWKYDHVKVVGSHIRSGNNIRNHLWEQWALPRLAKQSQVDILHSPANMAPLFYKGRSIVHIHDLCFVVNPQWYSYLFHSVYNFVIPRLARKATKVITNSNNSRNDLLQYCRIAADKVDLVYWAVDSSFKPGPQVYDRGEIPDYCREEYILYVGSLEPRKNISSLIEAYQVLRARHSEVKTKLILIGGESPLFAQVRLKIREYEDDVIFKGFVTDQELKNYYRYATVVAYPSLYEGFGLPPLEAMASGVPVVTSATSSIPEVVGDAAIMVSPFDHYQLADALARVIKNSDLRQMLREKGLRQVEKFNWQRVARNVLAIYAELAPKA